MALCCYREASGESHEGRLGVAWTIWNRAKNPKWWGSSPASVVLKPFQFSSFNKDDVNATKLPQETDPIWQDCLSIATEVMTTASTDPTKGATHYYADSMAAPDWAKTATLTAVIGHHRFFKDVP